MKSISVFSSLLRGTKGRANAHSSSVGRLTCDPPRRGLRPHWKQVFRQNLV